METVLDIEKEPTLAQTLAPLLAEEFRVLHCGEARRALEAAERHEADILLLDLDLPGTGGFPLLESLGRVRGGPPVIVYTARRDVRSVVRALRGGAADYLEKPAPLKELVNALRKASGHFPDQSGLFIGSSPSIRTVLQVLRRYAASDFPVLITGESGTGKELAARTLHLLSPRRERKFVPLNCAAIPTELIESELFGSHRGAFTDAVDRPGAFELAERGTLFLDEIGEAGLAIQAKLLRALESGELWRLGGREERRVDVRLVSATSRKLGDAVGAGSFRLDLLYRIETLKVEMPPLRARREDIPDLASFFVQKAAPGRKYLGLSALERLMEADWPGNARQLRNVVHRAIVLSDDREEIDAGDIVI